MRPKDFEWDPEKSRKNFEKHGIDFVAAQALWGGPVLEKPVKPGSDNERYAVFGMIDGMHWTAVITYRKQAVRIISVRRSRKKEVEAYDRFKRWQEKDNRRGV